MRNGVTEAPTVFIVDDDAAVRKGLAASLTLRGFEVASFESADAFLGGVSGNQPGCLILDVRMPKVNGLELQTKLLEFGITLPIIFISGHSDITIAVRAMRHGAIDFLEKPYEIDVLITRVKQALAIDHENREVDTEKQAIQQRFERLTKREMEVMSLLVAGAANTSNRIVAEKLGISTRTVDTYRSRLMEKMQARSLPDLVEMAKLCGVYK